MENLIQQLIVAIENSSKVSGWEIISAICSAISLVAIGVLLIERNEKKRPYLQITFELVRDNLVCLVLRNVGEVPAILQEIAYGKEFVKQLPAGGQKHLCDKANMALTIHPGQKWVIDLNAISSTVLHYKCQTLEVTLKYAKPGKSLKSYTEKTAICFSDYASFLIYISEIDELRKTIKAMDATLKKSTEKLAKALKIDTESPIKTTAFARLEDEYLRRITTEQSLSPKGTIDNPDDKEAE